MSGTMQIVNTPKTLNLEQVNFQELKMFCFKLILIEMTTK